MGPVGGHSPCSTGTRRCGESYDNAQAETQSSRFKTEEIERRDWPVFADVTDAQASAADYFDYCNHQDLHSRANQA